MRPLEDLKAAIEAGGSVRFPDGEVVKDAKRLEEVYTQQAANPAAPVANNRGVSNAEAEKLRARIAELEAEKAAAPASAKQDAPPQGTPKPPAK